MKRLPDAIFVVDLKKEQLAIREARRLGLPVVALVDTNCDPDDADYVIPGNDDAIRSCSLIVRAIANGIEAGKQKVTRRRDGAANGHPEDKPEPPPRRPAESEEPPPSRPPRRLPPRRSREPRAAGRGGECRPNDTTIAASQVKELRDMTGAPMMDAQARARGDRRRPRQGRPAPARARASPPRQSEPAARPPRAASSPGSTNAHGAIVAVGCETEPVSKNDEFLGFAERVIDAVEEKARRGRRGSSTSASTSSRGSARTSRSSARRASRPTTERYSPRTCIRRRRRSASSCARRARPTSRGSSPCTSPSRTRAS